MKLAGPARGTDVFRITVVVAGLAALALVARIAAAQETSSGGGLIRFVEEIPESVGAAGTLRSSNASRSGPIRVRMVDRLGGLRGLMVEFRDQSAEQPKASPPAEGAGDQRAHTAEFIPLTAPRNSPDEAPPAPRPETKHAKIKQTSAEEEEEVVGEERPAKRDRGVVRAAEPPAIDYRLASRIPAVVLLVEPRPIGIGELQPPTLEFEHMESAPSPRDEEDDADSEAASAPATPDSPSPRRELEASARKSLVVYVEPIDVNGGGLESIATLKADPALEDDEGLRPIGDVGVDIRPQLGELPTDYAAPRFARLGEIYQTMGAKRDWGLYSFNWECKGLCYGPLRFEEVNLERHGYSLGLAQPVVSGVHFFGTLPLLPYSMTADKRWDCQYCLGYGRPGTYTPFRRQRMPFRWDAVAAETLAVTGVVFILP